MPSRVLQTLEAESAFYLCKTPIPRSVNSDWIALNNIIIRNAKKTIPRDNFWKHKKLFTHNTQPLQGRLKESKHLFNDLDSPIDNLTGTKLQNINADIKLTYAEIKEAANLLSTHHQKISNLDFYEAGRLDKRKASNMVHGCRSKTNLAIIIFSRDFGMHELDEVLHDTDLRKSTGLAKIHGCMIDHLSRDARRNPLYIINISWSSGSLPQDWK
ncbi:uncharacterized protein NPIL_569311 [Nephila pilipes]|uniref:Uncharacterized protein n=1 Tax=Nephila pilipes TaxID=299642 RepID=A0A8X6TQK8_NEPPI|nr:uncharacterized protein NPIL_569311 [Nephila pilipes]